MLNITIDFINFYHLYPLSFGEFLTATESKAEVDFLFTKDQQVIPVEVKSGTQGGLKSLHAYLGLHPLISYGLKISEGFFGEHGNIRELPLYGLESWFNS